MSTSNGNHTTGTEDLYEKRIAPAERLISLVCALIAGVGNAVIFVLCVCDSHGADEYVLCWSFALLCTVVVCVPLAWKKSRSLAITSVVLSLPMMWLWGLMVVAIVRFGIAGDT